MEKGDARIWQAKGWFWQQYRLGAESRHWYAALEVVRRAKVRRAAKGVFMIGLV